MGATFVKYAPEKGALTAEADRPVIVLLTADARSEAQDAKGYWGSTDEKGHPHGCGKRVFDDGGVYEGEWVHGKEHGQGIYLWTWGDRYEGGWVDGAMEGLCVHTYADGGRFEGRMVKGVREGTGKFSYHFGDEFNGLYSNDLKVAGVWSYTNGDARVCRWELHESGSYSVIKGDGAKWSADRATAWRLLDGELVGKVPLEEAEAIAVKLGFARPSGDAAMRRGSLSLS